MDIRINEIQFKDFSVSMLTRRKLDRVLTHNTAGEDLVDHGRSSFEFELHGKMDLETYLTLLKDIEEGRLTFGSDFGDYNVVAKEVLFHDDGNIYLKLVEDINPE